MVLAVAVRGVLSFSAQLERRNERSVKRDPREQSKQRAVEDHLRPRKQKVTPADGRTDTALTLTRTDTYIAGGRRWDWAKALFVCPRNQSAAPGKTTFGRAGGGVAR